MHEIQRASFGCTESVRFCKGKVHLNLLFFCIFFFFLEKIYYLFFLLHASVTEVLGQIVFLHNEVLSRQKRIRRTRRRKAPDFVEISHLFLMNIQRSNPINISRYGRSRHKAHDFEELSCLRTTESHQSFSPNLGSPSPPETPDSSHCISRIGDYLLLEPLEGDHVFRAAHLHSGDELVCKVSRQYGNKPSLFRSMTLLPPYDVNLGRKNIFTYIYFFYCTKYF